MSNTCTWLSYSYAVSIPRPPVWSHSSVMFKSVCWHPGPCPCVQLGLPKKINANKQNTSTLENTNNPDLHLPPLPLSIIHRIWKEYGNNATLGEQRNVTTHPSGCPTLTAGINTPGAIAYGGNWIGVLSAKQLLTNTTKPTDKEKKWFIFFFLVGVVLWLLLI